MPDPLDSLCTEWSGEENADQTRYEIFPANGVLLEYFMVMMAVIIAAKKKTRREANVHKVTGKFIPITRTPIY